MASTLFGPKNPQMQTATPRTGNSGISENQLKAALNIVKQYGNGDARTAFFNLAKEKGVDPESILARLR